MIFRRICLAAAAVVAAASLVASPAFGQASSAADAGDEIEAPVELSETSMDFADVVDGQGKPLHILESLGKGQDEQVAAAITSDGETVVLTNLLAPPDTEPISDAPEPGPDGWKWEEGVNFVANAGDVSDIDKTPLSDIPDIDPDSLQIAISTATTETSYSAAWPSSAESVYEVTKDGVILTTTTGGAFVDADLQPSESHIYVARGVDGPDVGVEKIFNATSLPSSSNLIASKSASPARDLAAKLQPTAEWFIYNTFIKDRYVGLDVVSKVGGQCEGSLTDKFGGDNRDYVKPTVQVDPWLTAGHRTGVRVKADFLGSTPSVVKERSIGESHLYSKAGKLLKRKTASTSGIKFTEEAKSANLYRVKISHTVGNPFCKTGAIRYNVYLKIWKSGVMALNGSRQPIPAHESYGLFMNSNGSEEWVTMYRGHQGDFFCLGGLCPTDSIKKTYTPK